MNLRDAEVDVQRMGLISQLTSWLLHALHATFGLMRCGWSISVLNHNSVCPIIYLEQVSSM